MPVSTNCIKGVMQDRIFHCEDGSHYFFYLRKGLSIPEGIDIFLQLDQHGVVIDYVNA